MTIYTQVTATRYPDLGTVRLVIANTFPPGLPSGYTQTVLSVHRIEAGGPIPVRTLADLLPSTDTQIVVEDHEYPLGVTLAYRIEVENSLGETARIETSVPAEPLDAAPAWLTVPQRPVYDVKVPLVTGYEASRQPQTTIHTIIGRPDPLATVGVLGLRTGTLAYWCDDYALAAAVAHVYSLGLVTLLRPPADPGLMLYHVATDAIEIAPYSMEEGYPIRWQVRVPYAEVATPPGPTTGSVLWTFDALAAEYATFEALPAVFANFDAMTVGI